MWKMNQITGKVLVYPAHQINNWISMCSGVKKMVTCVKIMSVCVREWE